MDRVTQPQSRRKPGASASPVPVVHAALHGAPADASIARIGYTEHEIAAAIGVSVHWVRKDRLTARRLPFYRLGERVVYDLGRVREALSALEVGGIAA